MHTHLNIRVSGRVQGVNYRWSARGKALELGLSGFVRNEQDGSVYLEAEGSVESIDKLVAWCRQGPPHAQVMDVSVSEGQLRGFEGFEIRRQ